MKHYGYMGRLCRVDLTKRKIQVEELNQRDLMRFIGCSGFAAKLLWDETESFTDPR